MISKVNPSLRSRKNKKIFLGGLILLLGFIAALSIRDSCYNPNYASYGDVSDCPAQR